VRRHRRDVILYTAVKFKNSKVELTPDGLTLTVTLGSGKATAGTATTGIPQ
jgi:hypothetical protein